MIFTSHKERKDGLYETIFNDETKPEEMFASFCMFDMLTDIKAYPLETIFFSHGFHALTASKIVIQKYLNFKSPDINITNYIIDSVLNKKDETIRKCLQYASKAIYETLVKNSDDGDDESTFKFISNKSHFDLFLENIEKEINSPSDIDQLTIILVDEDDESVTEKINIQLH